MSKLVAFITKLINSMTLRGIFLWRFATPGACASIELALAGLSPVWTTMSLMLFRLVCGCCADIEAAAFNLIALMLCRFSCSAHLDSFIQR